MNANAQALLPARAETGCIKNAENGETETSIKRALLIVPMPLVWINCPVQPAMIGVLLIFAILLGAVLNASRLFVRIVTHLMSRQEHGAVKNLPATTQLSVIETFTATEEDSESFGNGLAINYREVLPESCVKINEKLKFTLATAS
jgi:hypothetical protein